MTTINQNAAATTGRAGLSYVFDNGVAPYVSYSTSFEPVVGLFRVGSNGSVFQPTTGEGKEVGVKYQPFDLNALFTASLFEITQQNVLTADPLNPLFSVQTGEVRVRGYEFDAKLSLTERLDLVGGVTHIEPIVTASTTGNVGKDLVNIPRDYASLWGNTPSATGRLPGSVSAAARAISARASWHQFNTVEIPGYTLFDATVSYDLAYLDPEIHRLQGAGECDQRLQQVLRRDLLHRAALLRPGGAAHGAGDAEIRLELGPVTSRNTSLRRWSWIHTWSSLVCTAFMLLLCITGLPLIFHEEIDDLLHEEVAEPAAPPGAPPADLDGSSPTAWRMSKRVPALLDLGPRRSGTVAQRRPLDRGELRPATA